MISSESINPDIVVENDLPTPVQQENAQEEIPADSDRITDYTYKDIRRGHIIKFKENESDEAIEGKALFRAGKVGNQFEDWWNIENLKDGVKGHFDTSKFASVEKVTADENEHVETAFVVQIPKYLHNESRCMDAKEKELSCWDEFGVIEEVRDEGQKTLGTNWILVEKVIDGEMGDKARLCVRGDQEQASFRTDSPTVHKSSLNVFFMLAAEKGWHIQTGDVKCAFLQGEELDRDVYLRPPKERRIDGMIWKMRKPAYGLRDASRKFYLQLCTELKALGCKQSKYDPAVYLYYHNNDLEGVVLTHVDDLMHGSGGSVFYKCVMKPLKEIFKFGSEEAVEFRYVGMQVKQCEEFISVNQDYYLSAMDIPKLRSEKEHEQLDEEGQSEYRSVLGRIGWLGNLRRLDLTFDHISMSTKLGKAMEKDMSEALKIMKKMVASSTEVKFPCLGDRAKWVMEVYADTGFNANAEFNK